MSIYMKKWNISRNEYKFSFQKQKVKEAVMSLTNQFWVEVKG